MDKLFIIQTIINNLHFYILLTYFYILLGY